jgi:hypothetical protein
LRYAGRDEAQKIRELFGQFVVENKDKLSEELITSTYLDETYDAETKEFSDELAYKATWLIGGTFNYGPSASMSRELKQQMENRGHDDPTDTHWKPRFITLWSDKKLRKKVQDDLYELLVNFEEYYNEHTNNNN